MPATRTRIYYRDFSNRTTEDPSAARIPDPSGPTCSLRAGHCETHPPVTLPGGSPDSSAREPAGGEAPWPTVPGGGERPGPRHTPHP